MPLLGTRLAPSLFTLGPLLIREPISPFEARRAPPQRVLDRHREALSLRRLEDDDAFSFASLDKFFDDFEDVFTFGRRRRLPAVDETRAHKSRKLTVASAPGAADAKHDGDAAGPVDTKTMKAERGADDAKAQAADDNAQTADSKMAVSSTADKKSIGVSEAGPNAWSSLTHSLTSIKASNDDKERTWALALPDQFAASDVSVTLDDTAEAAPMLTVRGTRRHESGNGFSESSFAQTFSVPSDIELDGITVVHDAQTGKLTVTAPKKSAAAKGELRSIPIKRAASA